MGMPGTAPTRWTREMVLALPDDGNRYELFDGELLVTPAPTPRHQFALACLYDAIAPFVRAHAVGHTFWSPADLRLGGEQASQPDLFVVAHVPADWSWGSFPNPILVIEVLSPGSARADRIVKRRRFQRSGVPEYWVVDLDARAIERWQPDEERPEVLDQRLVWRPASTTEALELELPALFERIWASGL